MKHRCLALAALLLARGALAQELAPEPGRYKPLYPSFYWTGGYVQDARDSSYDQSGTDRDSATPTYGATSFPERALVNAFTWHFPMFESQGLPFFSSRMHLARVTLRYVDTRTDGALATFAADSSDDAATNADSLKNNGKGVGDLTLEFGSYLYGAPSSGWRTGAHSPLNVLLLAGVNAPTGVYEHESPNNAGTNHWAFSGALAAHWDTPWPGGSVEGGYAYRVHSVNYQSDFGNEAPFRAGDERLADLSIGQRVFTGLYLSLFATDRKGKQNQYRNLDFTPNAPPAPMPTGGNFTSRNFPTPGTYFDDGTALRSYGAGVQYFLAQRWRVSVDYTRPQSGRSGQFMQPFTNRQCTATGGQASSTCTDTQAPGSPVLVDGLGSARSYSSDSLMLTVTHHFGLGDAFSCAGCQK